MRMRTFYLTFALWKDPFWRVNFRRSWKTRRYWLAKPTYPHVQGRAVSLQFGPLTVIITAAVGAACSSAETHVQPQRRIKHG
jgi:hypothetical protein